MCDKQESVLVWLEEDLELTLVLLRKYRRMRSSEERKEPLSLKTP